MEVTFYLFLPFYAWVIARTSKRDGWLADAIGLTLLTALAFWFHYRVQDELDHVQFYYSLLGRFDWFVPGMALAVASVLLGHRAKRPRLVRMVERWPSACWIGAGACAFLLCTSIGRFPLNTPSEAIVETAVYALLGFLFILPAVFGEDQGGAPLRLLAIPVIAWIGLISYGIYLWHEPIALVRPQAPRLPGGLVATPGLTVLCAAVSWYLFEKPIIAWGRRLAGLRAQTRRAHVGS